VLVPDVRAGSLLQQEGNAPSPAHFGCIVEGSFAIAILLVDLGSILYEDPEDANLLFCSVEDGVEDGRPECGIEFADHVGLPEHKVQHFRIATRSSIVGNGAVPTSIDSYLLSFKATFAPFLSSNWQTNSFLQ
jgi:hypothetical protein